MCRRRLCLVAQVAAVPRRHGTSGLHPRWGVSLVSLIATCSQHGNRSHSKRPLRPLSPCGEAALRDPPGNTPTPAPLGFCSFEDQTLGRTWLSTDEDMKLCPCWETGLRLHRRSGGARGARPAGHLQHPKKLIVLRNLGPTIY